MKQKLGLFTALILTFVIAGSTFAANIQTTAKSNMTATKSTKTKKTVKKKSAKHPKTAKSKAMKKTTTKKAASTAAPSK